MFAVINHTKGNLTTMELSGPLMVNGRPNETTRDTAHHPADAAHFALEGCVSIAVARKADQGGEVKVTTATEYQLKAISRALIGPRLPDVEWSIEGQHWECSFRGCKPAASPLGILHHENCPISILRHAQNILTTLADGLADD